MKSPAQLAQIDPIPERPMVANRFYAQIDFRNWINMFVNRRYQTPISTNARALETQLSALIDYTT